MPDRSSVAQRVQVRKEGTYGTDPGSGTKSLSALGLALTPKADFPDPFRPMGTKFPTLDPLGKEWSAADVSGRATFTELIYPLAMFCNTPGVGHSITVVKSPATAQTGVLSYEWIFTAQNGSNDTPTSFTAEMGDANFGDLVTGLILTDFNIDVDRNGISLGGTGMARQFSSGVTLAGSPTAIALVPILPSQVDIYMDATAAALGTTKLTRAFSAKLSLSNRFGGIWPLDSSQASYASFVETVPDSGFELVVEADTVGEGLLTAMRADTAKFIRLEAFGATIETISSSALKYAYRQDVCAHITGEPSYGDQDGVETITWPMKLFYDPTWAKAFEIRLVNTLAAL